jgi:hypothetical protein
MLQTPRKFLRAVALSIPPIAKIHQRRKESLNKIENETKDKNGLPSILNDNFTQWTKNAISGWCPDSNISTIDKCIEMLPAKGAIIEIGSFCGFSASIIAHCMRRYNKTNRFYSMDDWIFEGFEKLDKNGTVSGAFTLNDWVEHTEAMFKLAIKLSAKNINHSHIKLKSNEFFKLWESNSKVIDLNNQEQQLGGEIAFAYIDGDHSYAGSKEDFLNIDKFLVPGGFVFFDDSADNVNFGCKDVANEVAQLSNYKLVSSPATGINKCFMKLSV